MSAPLLAVVVLVVGQGVPMYRLETILLGGAHVVLAILIIALALH
jgi:hypothetical protein